MLGRSSLHAAAYASYGDRGPEGERELELAFVEALVRPTATVGIDFRRSVCKCDIGRTYAKVKAQWTLIQQQFLTCDRPWATAPESGSGRSNTWRHYT